MMGNLHSNTKQGKKKFIGRRLQKKKKKKGKGCLIEWRMNEHQKIG
jgi:hypothetical protein